MATRIPPTLLAELERLDDGARPVAEIWRGVGIAADRLGIARPCYERVRVLVKEQRSQKRLGGDRTRDVVLDVVSRARPIDALADHLAGVPLPPRRAGTL